MRRTRDGHGRGSTDGPSTRRPGAPPPGLFREVVLAPDREPSFGGAPVVSFRGDDEAAFLAELERRARRRVVLRRRGRDHGAWAELDPRGLLPPNPRRRRREALFAERWHAARPSVLAGVALDALGRERRREARELGEALARPAALEPWLRERLAAAGGFRVVGPAPAADPERDLARVLVAMDGGPDDLWCKTGRLSTHDGDRSLRLRVAFGREGDDDASPDEARHRAVAALAERILPGATELAALPGLREPLERVAGGPVRFTQHIAYWNSREGGALFHHDAFDEDGASGQRAVVFVQVVGSTAWLALSIEDLALRVREFLGWLEEGELPWLAGELGPDLPRLAGLARDRTRLLGELAAPGCGSFGPIVNHGPEFTSFLADAGHAALLHPGDAILLPNHGYARTAMHSVFCASARATYGLSMAVRSA